MSPQDAIAKVVASLKAAGHAVLEALDGIDLCHNTLVDFGVSHTSSGETSHAEEVASHVKTTTTFVFSLLAAKIRDRLMDLLHKAICSGTTDQLPGLLQIIEDHEMMFKGCFEVSTIPEVLSEIKVSEDRDYCCLCRYTQADMDPRLVTILNYNGRSLDSHNPWHLHESYEDHLDRVFALDKSESAIHDQASLNENCAASAPPGLVKAPTPWMAAAMPKFSYHQVVPGIEALGLHQKERAKVNHYDEFKDRTRRRCARYRAPLSLVS